MARAAKAVPATDQLGIRDLLSFRLHRLTNLLSRSAALRYRQDFDVSLGEWRTLALLGTSDLSLNRLARHADLDKAQISRIVSALVERGLVERKGPLGRGKTIELTLTRRGRALYGKLIAAATEREHLFAACLTQAERAALESAILKLSDVANGLIEASGAK